jgi:glutamate/tyrosine decarboxylase-like PLP-dependent enzyme
MGDLPGAEVLWLPTLNQGLVRYLCVDAGKNATLDDHNKRTADVLARINNSGKAFFSGTTWRGQYAIRISVVNFHTSDADVATTLEAVREAVSGAV